MMMAKAKDQLQIEEGSQNREEFFTGAFTDVNISQLYLEYQVEG